MQIARPDTAPRLVRWHGANIAVRPLLNMTDASNFVNGVMRACYDGKRDMCFPEAMELSIRAYTVMYYSNARLPEDLEKQNEILFGSDLYDTLRREINLPQHEALVRAVELCMGSAMR